MSNPTGKRGFVPAQPAAAISALDFAAASEAFAAARAKDNTAKTDTEAAAIADLIAQGADRLIGIPATNPSQIAEKVNAFLWLHGTGGDLSDPATQHRIAASQNEPAKCLLAIYLDLTHSRDRKAWNAAVQAVETAWAEVEAVNARERATDEDCSDEWNAAWGRHSRTLEALINTRAPDAAAMGLKARLIIQKALLAERSDDPDNPDTLSRLMGDGDWSEHALAALYQDGLAAAGIDSPAARALPESFDGVAWYQEAEAAFGVRLDPEKDKPLGVTAIGRDKTGALAAYAALAAWKQGEAWSSIVSRQEAEAQAAQREAAEARGPTPPAELRGLFVNGLLNTFAEDGEREAVRANLASMGLVAQ